MDEDAPNYRAEFLKSPHHGWLGLLTVGAGFVTGSLFGLIVGATAYTIGWIYLPDLPLFQGWVNRRRDDAKRQIELAKIAGFTRRRDTLLGSLSPERVARYRALAEVCQNIEDASADTEAPADPRLRRLDELMWTFLRLLTIEESLERFLETEDRDQVPVLAREGEHEVNELKTEIESLKSSGNEAAVDSKQRYFASRMERLDVLRKRLERSQQARDNLLLVRAEQDRLDQQIKLIRADAVAARNAGALTARIDATVEHLDQTNKWLAEMDDFKDLVGDLPDTEMRVGFNAAVPSTVPPPLRQTNPRVRVNQ